MYAFCILPYCTYVVSFTFNVEFENKLFDLT